MDAPDSSVVAVFGANDPAPGEAAYELARRVGATLAGLGYAVANGGYGGTMEASARGAKETGGHTIGVTCRVWRAEPNRWIDRAIVTASLMQRVRTLIDVGQAGYVVLPGATGTLVELATAWEMIGKGLLDRRPIVCTGEFWRPLIQLMGAARPRSTALVAIAEGVEDLSRHFPPRRSGR